ncbi:MAG: lysophospholipid acyltransferase family protein [Streptosporangiaceae bacterium]
MTRAWAYGATAAGAAGAAGARRVLWRAVLSLTGGLRVHGAAELPPSPCVIVANHSSHADTAALIAALPAWRRPVVAAAADYWFRGGFRPAICRALCAAFPVRRSGGGSADLTAAARLLAAGHDVIVFPEGTRSRDGQPGEFRRGAARLAAVAGAPLVPAGISGTRSLLPPGGFGWVGGFGWAGGPGRAGGAGRLGRAGRLGGAGRPRRAAVTVRFGAPVFVGPVFADLAAALDDATAEARERVVALATGSPRR